MFDVSAMLSQPQIVLIALALVMIVFDVLTGIIKAAKTHSFSSGAGRDGIFHKTALVLVIILGLICHIAQLFVDLGIHVPLLDLVCAYVIFNEILSSIENIGVINPALQGTKVMQLFDFAKDADYQVAQERAGEED